MFTESFFHTIFLTGDDCLACILLFKHFTETLWSESASKRKNEKAKEVIARIRASNCLESIWKNTSFVEWRITKDGREKHNIRHNIQGHEITGWVRFFPTDCPPVSF